MFRRFRKRVETLFSQLDDQFMLARNYAKDTTGIFTRILAKITTVTALQYMNEINKRPKRMFDLGLVSKKGSGPTTYYEI